MVGGSQAVMNKRKENSKNFTEPCACARSYCSKKPEVSMERWQKEYLAIEGAHVDSSSSGLFSMFYARYFDGKTITRILTYESQQFSQVQHPIASAEFGGERG